MTIRYVSTRGEAPMLGFADAVLAGLASDGGLYVPESVPTFSPQEMTAMARLPYAELAYQVMAPFVGDALSETELRDVIAGAYATFRHEAVTPLVQLGEQTWVLELFHGPTLAFKDVALQFLGRLFDVLLAKRGERITIVGATSGDTGSAAIAGCQGRANMDIVILHPHGKASEVQRRQMTTVLDVNVHNVALKGTFDDCQNMVKALFADADFRTSQKLAAVNSINWARILAQVVYYFYAALSLGAPAKAMRFSVPTGNFGDIFAGYIAHRMGLPIRQLMIATNRNDILHRCISRGEYRMDGVYPTLSPSMDIEISSNFERLLFDLYDRDGAAIRTLMQQLKETKSFTLDASRGNRAKQIFSSGRVDDALTLATMKDVWDRDEYVMDPHTAVGYAAAKQAAEDPSHPLIILATAHPAKFPDAVKQATGIHPKLPSHLADLLAREERCHVMPAHDMRAMQTYIYESCPIGVSNS